MATNNLIVCSYLDLKIKSEHPIAQAIVRKATEKNSYIKDLSLILLLASAITSYFEKMRFVGNHRKINNQMIGPQNLSGRITELGSEGKNVIAAFIEDKLVGLLAVSDTLRENAKQVIA